MHDAIIFDFDGVILDSEPLHYEACCVALNGLGIQLSYKDYLTDCLGLPDKEMFPQLLMSQGHYLSAKELGQLIDKKIESYAKLINSRNKLPFVAGIEHYITEAKIRQKKIAVCTGSTKTEMLPVFERFKTGHLDDYIDVIVTSEDVEYGKPSPEGYLLTLELLGCSAEQCIAFEDSPYGINAAKKAGIHVTALDTSHPRHELQNADVIVSSFDELLTTTTLTLSEEII